MILWSLHPKYLDTFLLENLLYDTLDAKKMIREGDDSSPQLTVFLKTSEPEKFMNTYIYYIFNEFRSRQIKLKIPVPGDLDKVGTLAVTSGQLEFEKKILLSLYHEQNKKKMPVMDLLESLNAHPLFSVITGEPELWTENFSLSFWIEKHLYRRNSFNNSSVRSHPGVT